MTTILPAERTPFDVLGRDVGQALQQVLPGAVQKGYQRQIGHNAIDELQRGLQNAKSINDVLPLLARAYTDNPALERSGLGQQFLQQFQRGRGAQEFPAGANVTSQGIPTQASPEAPEKQVPISVSDLVPPKKPEQEGNIKDPTAVQNFVIPYGPEDIANIRQQARIRQFSPEMEERFVEDALEYNRIAQDRRNSEIQNYAQQQQQRNDTLENQRLFNNYVRENAPEFASNPDELQLALQESDKYQGEKSFADRLAKVKEAIRPYQVAKKSLQTALKRPLFGFSEERLNLLRPGAKEMVRLGQKPQLQLMIADGGQGQVEEALLLNPLPAVLDKRLESFPKFVNPLDRASQYDVDSPKFLKSIEEGEKQKSEQLDKVSDYLSKAIYGGTYKDPGPNLLLIRKHLMDNGLLWNEAGTLINKSLENGKVQLDPQQKIDLNKLAYPPLMGDSYLDSIMNELMFPITGKE